MKKFKRIIAGLLALSLLFLCTACMIQGEKDNKKWVLVDEKTFLVGTNGEVLQSEMHYGYDSYGRINEQLYKSSSSYKLNYSEFKYDDRGNVISCTRSDLSSIITDCYYEYDSSNNLIKLTEKDLESTSETEYQYNEYGDKEYEKYHYKSDSYDMTETMHYAHSYNENGALVYSEETRAFSDTEGAKYWLYKYVYDANGNRIEEYQYIAEDDYSGDGGEKIEYSGKKYVLQYIKYYTYEQREFEVLDINSDTGNSFNSNDENDFSGNEETTTESETITSAKLSDECDKVIASGYNSNNDYYELVAIESQSYNSKCKIGVIKNNKWLIEPTSNCPFVDDSGSIMSIHSEVKVYTFCCESCFAYGYSNEYGIIWNVEENTVFIAPTLSDGRAMNIVSFDTRKVSSDGAVEDFKIKNYTKVFYSDREGTKLLDTATMNSTLLTAEEFECPANISEGLFFSRDYDDTKRGFYDENFNLVIDLSNYNINTKYYNMYFYNGVCNFSATNASGVTFIITIDKEGNVISESR